MKTRKNSNIKVSRSIEIRPWKCGRVEVLVFFNLVSPFVSLMGKTPWVPVSAMA